jgi:hypothetical protein
MRDGDAGAPRHQGDGGMASGRSGSAGSGRKRAGTKVASKSIDAKSERVHYRFGRETTERLRIHCALAHRRNEGAVVEEILLRYLRESGKGRNQYFDQTSKGREDLSPDTQEDRQDTTAA